MPNSKIRFTRSALFVALASSTAIASIAGYFGQYCWLFDLCSHFRLVYIGAFLLFAVISSVRRLPFTATFSFALLTLNLFTVWFQLAPPTVPSTPARAAHGSAMRVLQMNIWSRNSNFAGLQRLIVESDADLVALEEYTDQAHAAFTKANLFHRYPFYIIVPSYNGGSENALLSRFPLQDIQIVHSSDHQDRTILARAILPITNTAVLVMHPRSPGRPATHQRNCLQLRTSLGLAPALPPNVILVGDLNTTPFSHHFQQLLRTLHLRDTRTEGPMPTWPRWFPIVPIDFVLVSQPIQVRSCRTLLAAGSDHLAIVVDLLLPDTKPSEYILRAAKDSF